jgi:hypothetical protein
MDCLWNLPYSSAYRTGSDPGGVGFGVDIWLASADVRFPLFNSYERVKIEGKT